MRKYEEEDFNEEYERGYRAGRREALRKMDEYDDSFEDEFLEESFVEKYSDNKSLLRAIELLSNAKFTKEEKDDCIVFTGRFLSIKLEPSRNPQNRDSVVIGTVQLIRTGEFGLGLAYLDELKKEAIVMTKIRDLNRKNFVV